MRVNKGREVREAMRNKSRQSGGSDGKLGWIWEGKARVSRGFKGKASKK